MVTDVSDAKLLRILEEHPNIERLFPDYAAADHAIWVDAGIYPPMHVIVMSGRLNRENPDLAAKLYRALMEAKNVADDDIANDRAGFSVLYLRETFERQRAEWGDPMRYGVSANRRLIEALIDYNVREGATRQRMPVESIFAAATLDT
jgi:4,5-dihydroxyphthalate decarboxylase